MMHPQQAFQLQEITGGQWKNQPFSTEPIRAVFTDSRKIYSIKNSIFIALSGPNHAGKDFLLDAYHKGVRQFVVSDFSNDLPEDAAQLKVNDTLFALHQWAVFVRKQFKDTVIAVTGSNGKTMFKEWFYSLLEEEIPILKSPKSYNSQLGVPLSILPLSGQHAMAVFEAGISQKGEMQRLERLIKPNIGVFTHLGSAHSEGFENIVDKLQEKLKLFSHCKTLILPQEIYKPYQVIVDDCLPDTTIITVGKDFDADYRVVTQVQGEKTQFVFQTPQEHVFQIPFTDLSSIPNALLAIVCYLHLKMPVAKLQRKLNLLRSIPMRQQFIKTHEDAVIINDSYSLDWESLHIALDFLEKQGGERKRTLILSDFPESTLQSEVKALLPDLLHSRNIDQFIGIGNAFYTEKPIEGGIYFKDLASFLESYTSINFNERAVLIKGARKFKLEQIANVLQSQRHQTLLEINLSALVRNFHTLKNTLPSKVKTMAMVKAAAYGGGTLEVANMLEKHGVDFIGVAFTQEGVQLRKSGLKLPILVLNPWLDEAEDLVNFQLTPSIYRLETLKKLEQVAKSLGKKIEVHLKVETGMNRLGFQEKSLPQLCELLHQLYHVFPTGVYSHFAAADEADFDGFTQEQIARFKAFAVSLEIKLGKKLIKHICNTSGMLRFPDAHFDMVRIGIGLYGYNPTQNKPELELAMTFKSTLSQVKVLAEGESVGYGRRFVAKQQTKIGILPIGYADGLPRNSGNGNFSVLIPNHGTAPILGNVCMDMCMIDLSNTDAKEGDVVVIFGLEHSINYLAKANRTIPYEILSGVSERVKRVYYED